MILQSIKIASQMYVRFLLYIINKCGQYIDTTKERKMNVSFSFPLLYNSSVFFILLANASERIP
jgi:hypothetical protein